MSFSGLSLKVGVWYGQDLVVIGQTARLVSCIRTARTVRIRDTIFIVLEMVVVD